MQGDGSRQPAARDGIALIVVLGMLALMVLMGIAFSIYMRTERVAAGNAKAYHQGARSAQKIAA